ncbi:TetR/AcrR family transcriptional regulator [Streptomyces fulvoviolaceus]|uniref:TetR/AcrR family transcriptional regulator n=1 Tax=Streptomyces fulvoviolaceus TaxID=285535 RepID=UPI0021BE3071|nr:TetR/AcrR family transcriptional regulator [Streptomyces fulvoviolaceus]MCT9075106.1 TetR/AcrR family transcriptional regulator [Streptomyces fulvoviolaceus]
MPPPAVPRKRPRQERSRDTYDAIVEAAAQLFQRDGYARATTNRIAERAGVSIGTLYQYFPNKDALLYAIGEEHVHRVQAELADLAEGLRRDQPPLPDCVHALLRALADLHLADPRMHRLLYDQAPRPAETAAQLREVQGGIAAEVEFHLRRLGVGGPDPGLTAILVVQGVEGQLHGALLDPPAGRTVEEVLGAVETLCLKALAS